MDFEQTKEGREKGVPFNLIVDTSLPDGPRLHAASCLVKVYNPGCADRKHAQDREKLLSKSAEEQATYQPKREFTVLYDVSPDLDKN